MCSPGMIGLPPVYVEQQGVCVHPMPDAWRSEHRAEKRRRDKRSAAGQTGSTDGTLADISLPRGRVDAYALDAFPRYTGKKISAMKVSRVVGVAFGGERSSSIFMWPELSASAISSNRSAMLDDIPICISTGFNCTAGTSLYARSALPIAAPTIFATSA